MQHSWTDIRAIRFRSKTGSLLPASGVSARASRQEKDSIRTFGIRSSVRKPDSGKKKRHPIEENALLHDHNFDHYWVVSFAWSQPNPKTNRVYCLSWIGNHGYYHCAKSSVDPELVDVDWRRNWDYENLKRASLVSYFFSMIVEMPQNLWNEGKVRP